MTLSDLSKICQHAHTATLAMYEEPLRDAMSEFDINTLGRECFFIAQVAHESGEFHYVREIASGSAYEGRADLGNIQPGDGIFFKGRGLLQITGRTNYGKCGEALGLPLLEQPELLEQPSNACRSAGWFWTVYKDLNHIADSGDFVRVTRKINGGLNGLADREMYLKRAQQVLG